MRISLFTHGMGEVLQDHNQYFVRVWAKRVTDRWWITPKITAVCMKSDFNTGTHSAPAVPSLRIYPREVDKSEKAEQCSSQLYLESRKTGKSLNMKPTLLKESRNIPKIPCHENQPRREMCEDAEGPLWFCSREEGVTKPKQLWVKQLTCFLFSSLCFSVFQFPPVSMYKGSNYFLKLYCQSVTPSPSLLALLALFALAIKNNNNIKSLHPEYLDKRDTWQRTLMLGLSKKI